MNNFWQVSLFNWSKCYAALPLCKIKQDFLLATGPIDILHTKNASVHNATEQLNSKCIQICTYPGTRERVQQDPDQGQIQEFISAIALYINKKNCERIILLYTHSVLKYKTIIDFKVDWRHFHIQNWHKFI